MAHAIFLCSCLSAGLLYSYLYLASHPVLGIGIHITGSFSDILYFPVPLSDFCDFQVVGLELYRTFSMQFDLARLSYCCLQPDGFNVSGSVGSCVSAFFAVAV